MPLQQFTKDPNAVLDYTFNWSSWLGSDTISTSAWTVQSGITRDSDSIVSGNKQTKIWLRGGTAGQAYTITNSITTAGGRTDDRSAVIFVEER